MTLRRNNTSGFLSLILISFLTSLGHQVFSQVSTLDNYQGTWSNPSSWVSGTQPNPLTTNINDAITIDGYITREGDLEFRTLSTPNDFLIRDTLVISGSITFANNSANLKIPAGGLLIVFGNFTANNKIEVDNGGLLIVVGDMSFSNSGQDEYIDSGGGLYVDGTVSGNPTAGGSQEPLSTLVDDGYQDIYDFVISGGTTPLPIELISFVSTPKGNAVVLNWSTASELNNDFFTIEKSRNGLDFVLLSKVEGNGTVHTRSDYSLTDHNPYLGLSYYRLSQTDFDGTTEVFPAVSCLFQANTNLLVYPNPTRDKAFSFRASGKEKNESMIINMFSLDGKQIFNKQVVADAFGNLDINLEVPSDLQKGTYILELLSRNEKEYIKLLVE